MADGSKEVFGLDGDPLWYKDAVIYELPVRAFYDSDGDGMGDFRGLIEKLDYLQDLGVTAIWLLPFCSSPLRDDGYDISDYTGIHPDYGTMQDFRAFLKEAHRRGLRVITELVLNHTSDRHPWFQRARRARPGSRWRDFYVWSDTPDKYQEARIIFKDFESSNWTWDPVAKAYFWHRFYSHQPDLNYDNPHVKRAIFRVIDFWFGMGVDGLRLDAVPYLYEREGTNCENLPETFVFLEELRAHVDGRFKSRILLAEANQWPEDAVAYFGGGNRAHMAIHFPLMPRLFMAVRMEDCFPIMDILDQTPPIPETCQWATFLRNHDEMTLEMVTDEERDYMYRVYAQDPRMRVNLGIRRRLAPLLENNRKRIELMNILLFSLPGAPIVYYGDEIRMGDNFYLGDRNGVRTPMQWSADRNAGFSTANPQRLYLPVIIDPEYHYETINVEVQQSHPHSLLWWMRRLIALRKRFKTFGRGSIKFLSPENRKVLAFIRSFEGKSVLVVANLSRFPQSVMLDLSAFSGMVPVEVFGRMEFPLIGEQQYPLTLGPYGYYLLDLQQKRALEEAVEGSGAGAQLLTLEVAGRWDEIFKGRAKFQLEGSLPRYLRACRWFGGKGRRMRSASVRDVLPVSEADSVSYIVLINVEYMEDDEEIYALPFAYAAGEKADELLRDQSQSVIVRVLLRDKGERGILYDAVFEEGFCESLLRAIARHRHLKGKEGELRARAERAFRRHMRGGGLPYPKPALLKAEQSNTSVLYGERLILKLFRRLQKGQNPDLEIGRFLTEKGFQHVPPTLGAIEYYRGREEPMTLGILQGFVANQGDAWRYTLDILGHYFEHALTRLSEVENCPLPPRHVTDAVDGDLPPAVTGMIGPYLESARLLGERTAEMHVAFASSHDEPGFAPEPFSKLYRRSLYQSMRSLTNQVFQLLRKNLRDMPEPLRGEAQKIIDQRGEIVDRFRTVMEKKMTAMRTRCHGDYHLGQILCTGRDFVIIDFEGEPARSLTERRIKRSPLRDVAGMLRSFHYAAYTALFAQETNGLVRHEDAALLEQWARLWCGWVSVAFLKQYLETALEGAFLPQAKDELQALLDAYILEKTIYELGYELNNRPDWVRIPMRGIMEQLEISG